MKVPVGRGSWGPGQAGLIRSYRQKLKIGRCRTAGCLLNAEIIDGDIAQLCGSHTCAGHKAQSDRLSGKSRKIDDALKPLISLIA